MNIAFIPIDNRPVCYNLAKDIVLQDSSLTLLIPPREFLGDLHNSANIPELFSWLSSLENIDCLVISLDTIIYGGLIPSRRSTENIQELQKRLSLLKPLLQNKKVYAFSSIMRISNNNYNDEEKFYWRDYGKKIFEYSYNYHKTGIKLNNGIPTEILEDYFHTRERNFEINKILLQWKQEGIFNTLIFSKDDCAEYGLNVAEAQELEKLGAKIKTGADEIPLALLSRAIEKDIKIYPKFIEEENKHQISNYEDISVEKSVLSQIELSGFKLANNELEADIILIVNNFINKQGELVMGWDTKPLEKKIKFPDKPYCVADVRFANGADNLFVNELFKNIDIHNFYGYSGWNTTANTLGSLLAGVKIKYQANNYNENAFKKLQAIRFLDDWAYQANVRNQIQLPQNISNVMSSYENKISEILNYKISTVKYKYPWNRIFEIEIIL